MPKGPGPEAHPHAAYWRGRVREEAEAALASEDPRIAAIHVELATRYLRRASDKDAAAERA